MDKKSLHDLLESATLPEPPTGATPDSVIRAGIGLRRRRRAWYASGGAVAAVAVACAASLTVTLGTGGPAAAPGPTSGTVYVLGDGASQGTVTPISVATGAAGQPVVVRSAPANIQGPGELMAVTPDGKTIWASDGTDTVTAISTATNKAEKTITVVHGRAGITVQVLANPNGKDVYVLDSLGTVTPISTATYQPGTPIRLGRYSPDWMAITPDGRTLYVAGSGTQPVARPGARSMSDVIPIDTATGTAGAPIHVPGQAFGITITPDGRTVYVWGESATSLTSIIRPSTQVTPIPTATNTPGITVTVGTGGVGGTVMAPDGRTMYLLLQANNVIGPKKTIHNPSRVVYFSTVTNTPEKTINLGNPWPQGLAITPDGRTLYVPAASSSRQGDTGRVPGASRQCPQPGAVFPISTATGSVGNPITRVGCLPMFVAITPDGRTAYVVSGVVSVQTAVPVWGGSVTPVATSTNQPGKPISVGGQLEQILTVP